MTSHNRIYRNELIVIGPDVAEVLAQLGYNKNREEIDFGRVIEYPKHFRDLDDRSAEYHFQIESIPTTFEREATRSRKLYELADKFGVKPGTLHLPSGLEQGGYQWREQNWGTSHNARDVVVRIATGHLGSYANVAFTSEGGIPTKVIAKLSRDFLDYTFWFYAKESWSNWEYHMFWVVGQEKFMSRRRGFSRTIHAKKVIETT